MSERVSERERERERNLMNVTKNTDYKILLCVPVSIKYSQFCSFNSQIY